MRTVHAMLTDGTGTDGMPGEFRSTHAIIMDRGGEAFIACPPENLGVEFASMLDRLNTSGVALESLVCSTVSLFEF